MPLNRNPRSLIAHIGKFTERNVRLRTVILGVIRDESEVDDILHDVLLQVWDLGDKYKPGPPGPPRTPGHSGAPACTGSFESKGSLASRN